MTCANGNVFVSTACLPGGDSVEHRLNRYHEHGLDRVELGGGVTCEATAIDRLAASGRSFLVHNYFPPPIEPFVLNLASVNETVRQRSLEHVKVALSLASRLGAPVYSVHAGFIVDPIGRDGTGFAFPEPGSPDEGVQALERFEDAVRAALGHATSVGVRLLVENNVCRPSLRGKLLLQSADECAAVALKSSLEGLGLLIDTGHLNVTARTYGFDRLAFLEAVAPHIGAFHVHDNDGSEDTHEPIRPGSWVVDALRRYRRLDTPVVIEAKFNSVIHLQRQVEWLANELS